jgi:hypothetical protein
VSSFESPEVGLPPVVSIFTHAGIADVATFGILFIEEEGSKKSGVGGPPVENTQFVYFIIDK